MGILEVCLGILYTNQSQIWKWVVLDSSNVSNPRSNRLQYHPEDPRFAKHIAVLLNSSFTNELKIMHVKQRQLILTHSFIVTCLNSLFTDNQILQFVLGERAEFFELVASYFDLSEFWRLIPCKCFTNQSRLEIFVLCLF